MNERVTLKCHHDGYRTSHVDVQAVNEGLLLTWGNPDFAHLLKDRHYEWIPFAGNEELLFVFNGEGLDINELRALVDGVDQDFQLPDLTAPTVGFAT